MRTFPSALLALALSLFTPVLAEAQDAECFPSCRDGYLCHQGQCISACNPPCAAGERCTGAGECVLAQPASPPPASSGGAEPQQQYVPPPGQPSPPPAAQPYTPPAPPAGAQPEPPSTQPYGDVPPAEAYYVPGQPLPPIHEDVVEDPGADKLRIAIAPLLFGLGGGGTTFGFGLGIDRALGRYFALGGGARSLFYGGFQSYDTKGLDVFVLPRVRYGIGKFEVYGAVPFGLTLDFFPVGSQDSPSFGWNLAPVLGATVYVTPNVGLYGELGGLFGAVHVTYTDPVFGGLGGWAHEHQALITAGVAIVL